ncbi:hypothetical protein GYMLUDRAFT_202786 [Collybiopsis luxurians FD-317 M1]|uniref:Peptide hydrolase n=1 Tax=Collybiopsis luxurians FD-317 M1 TaxID=944289 RepID=A0A0D0CJ05_9AGAR|nr:hypothetical protein GYMLUDRAFT_202786 [Collybiopsis luxurians FD-317 M1]
MLQISAYLLFLVFFLLTTTFSPQFVHGYTSYYPHNRLGERAFPELSTHEVKALIDTPDPLKGIDRHLEKIMIPRVSDTENNTLVRNYIISTLQSLNWHVEQDPFEGQTPFGIKKFVNIIATKDIRASRRVVLSAHYDSKYFAPPNDQFVGATDSAFPCAVLLDIAESLNEMLEKRLTHLENDDLAPDEDEDVADTTLQLVFFDGEEAFVSWTDTDSIYGARNLADVWSSTYITSDSLSAVTTVNATARSLEEEGNDEESATLSPRRLIPSSSLTLLSTVEHLILLDLLGAKDPAIKSYFKDTAWLFEQLKNTESKLGAMDAFVFEDDTSMSSTTYRSYFHPVPLASNSINMGYMGDDHVPFLRRGVPVLHLISEPFPHVWHTIRDDGSALDRATMRRWNILMRVFTAEYLHLKPELLSGREEIRDELT